MAKNKKKKTQIPLQGFTITIAIIVILAIIFLITSGGPVYKSSAANQPEIEDNVKALSVLEEKTPTNFKLNRPGKIVDMQAEQEKILAMRGEEYDGETTRKWYQGTAMIGDSITLRTAAYGFLDYDVVCGEVGGALYNCDELIQAGIALHPYVVFLCFGANDTTGYVNNYDAFTEAYDNIVEQLKEALPEAVIYINCIQPPQPGNPNVDSSFQYRDDLNAALEKYCEQEEDVYYIDSGFILDNNTDLYDPDGIHPLGEFFPMWLTYMADVAGLSDEESFEDGQEEETEEADAENTDDAAADAEETVEDEGNDSGEENPEEETE